MAVPQTMTMKDISGSYSQSMTLSDEMDKVLVAKGVGWAMRKTMGIISMTMNLKHSADATPATLEFTMVPSSGPFKGITNVVKLDGEMNEKSGLVMGTQKSRVKVSQVDDVDDEWLREGWTEGTVIESWDSNSKAGWESHTCAGFNEIKGERYYVKKCKVIPKNGEPVTHRTVYEYKPLMN